MKAIIHRKYGSPDDLELRDVERPAPREGEVLLRVRASSINVADYIFLTGTPVVARLATGLFKPKHAILGHDVAGTVEAVGPGVTDYAPGDEVFGELDRGAYAEYVAAPTKYLAAKPANLTFEEAAAVPLAGITALQAMRDYGKVQAGHKVLVNGASGAVGTFAVQIAKWLGAEVTGVCSTRNAEMVRSLGADHVSDYTQEDFTQTGARYDLIFDLVGSRSIADCRGALTPTGIYLPSVGRSSHLFKSIGASIFHKQVVMMGSAKPNPKDLTVLKDLLEAGTLRPVIERTYTLSEVPLALRHQGEGHAQGKKVISVPAAPRNGAAPPA